MSLPIKKLYLDSRYKRHDSASNSNCKFELKQAIHLPLNCIAYIDDIQIPHTWYNISSSNNKLYVRMKNGTTVLDNIIQLDVKYYAVSELATDLNAKLAAAISNSNLTCTHNVRKSTITFTSNNGFHHRIFSDEELADMTSTLNGDVAWSGGTINATSPQSLNDVLRISGDTSYVFMGAQETDFINLRSIHNIYVTSPNLGSFDTLGPRGEQNIVKKVPVSGDWGYIIFDIVVSEHDYIDVSKGYFKTIELALRDVRGNVIDLNKAHWSLSIVFSMMKEKDI